MRSATAATSAQGHPASSCGIWHVAPGPNVRSFNNNLRAVATVSSGDMWAVGSTYSNQILSPSSTLTDHWNGTRWSIVPSPNVRSASNFLSAVAAVSSSDVWAVGSYYIDDRGSVGKTLIEHWNGTSWSIVPSPNVGSSFNQLDGVAVVSASDIWAAGNYISQNPAKTLIEHWNGTSWRVVASPGPRASNNELDQVTVASANDIWTVGSFSITNGNDQTLTEHWNGTSLNVVASPNVGSYSNYLRGVAAVSPQDIWAVGFARGDGRLGKRSLGRGVPSLARPDLPNVVRAWLLVSGYPAGLRILRYHYNETLICMLAGQQRKLFVKGIFGL